MAPPAALPSFWDRLIDAHPSNPRARGLPVAEFERTVLRHVEALLNERRSRLELSNGLQSTILGYGLAELASFDLSSPWGAATFAAAIAEAIRRFEPRLRNVTVLAGSAPGTFRVRAQLHIETALERIEFEAEISSDSDRVTVGRLGHPSKA